jgi:hypothetical protein
MQCTIDADEEFLRVRLSGRASDQPPSAVCARVYEESEKRGRPRILIELDQKVPLSPTSQYQLVTRLPQIGFGARHRIALVHGTPEMREANQFINLLASNHGVNVRNFPALAAAETWLRE